MGLSGELRVSFVAEMRFVGQAFEVPVELGEDDLACLTAERLHRIFGEAHQRVYFFGGAPDKQIEFVSFRLGVTAPLDVLPLLTEIGGVRRPRAGHRDVRLALASARAAHEPLGPRSRPADFWPRAARRPDLDALVPAGWTAERDANDNIILERMDDHA